MANRFLGFLRGFHRSYGRVPGATSDSATREMRCYPIAPAEASRSNSPARAVLRGEPGVG